ncbi:MAG: hypothetical protein K8S23_08140, partial [Candidatus Cloacimonetes bacterium]|nr:hypothetical protein [Candidatus Cloacimonadota bacterium]
FALFLNIRKSVTNSMKDAENTLRFLQQICISFSFFLFLAKQGLSGLLRFQTGVWEREYK